LLQRRGIPVSYGNTAGGLDGVSIASYSAAQQLPQYSYPQQYAPPFSPQQNGSQYQQPVPMFTPPAFNANASMSQRVPVFPSSRPPLGGNSAFPNQFNNTSSTYGGGGGGNMYNRSFPGSPEGNLQDMTWGNSMLLQQQQQQQGQGSAAGNQQMIFDRNLMTAENARKLGLLFNIAVQEIDLIDLPPMHSFAQNCPFVAAACGKWTASTDVSVFAGIKFAVAPCCRWCWSSGGRSTMISGFIADCFHRAELLVCLFTPCVFIYALCISPQPIQNAGETAFWTKLNWKSTCKSGGNLRLIVNSKKVVLGSINFSTEDLLNAVSDDKGLRRVRDALTFCGTCCVVLCVAYQSAGYVTRSFLYLLRSIVRCIPVGRVRDALIFCGTCCVLVVLCVAYQSVGSSMHAFRTQKFERSPELGVLNLTNLFLA
jgi:hypothetical protein